MPRRFLFTSEQVSDGHPDKLCDFISDSVLDALLAKDPSAKVACNALIKDNTVVLAGELLTSAVIDFEQTVRGALAEVGFSDQKTYLDPSTAKIELLLYRQSSEIARAVHENKPDEELCAGDQGIMVGYATDESPELLPLTLVLATRILMEASHARKSGEIPWLRPDGKSQVTLEYEQAPDGSLRPLRADTILVSVQHAEGVPLSEIQKTVKSRIIDKVVPGNLLDENTRLFINPSGSFVVGGPKADSGLTGRKIIADAYGGWGGHGGGAFSGKDPSKVDRSGAYAARWVAKSLVSNGYASRCVVQLSYGIGIQFPLSIEVDTFGSAKRGLKDSDLVELVKKNFDLRPGAIIRDLQLRRPIYRETCLFGHFMPKKNSLWEVPKIF